jgi:uncharacterized surface protein with fasciclin (FAS1) repeats
MAAHLSTRCPLLLFQGLDLERLASNATIFAPTDAAFLSVLRENSLSIDDLTSDVLRLVDILTYHVYMDADTVAALAALPQPLQMESGGPVVFSGCALDDGPCR